MPQTKRRLQIVTSLAVATFILVAGTIGAMTAAGRLRQMLERQMAEDSQVIGENLKIIISQATRELAQGERAFDKVQVVLESLQVGGGGGGAVSLASWTRTASLWPIRILPSEVRTSGSKITRPHPWRRHPTGSSF